MAGKIGVRELKNKASEIVREVHEQEAEFIVTLRGEPVAVIRPLTEKNRRDLREAEVDEDLAEIDRLAEKDCPRLALSKSALELLEGAAALEMPVVDASVCMAFFSPRELQHVPSRIWFREARNGDEQVVAPVILLAEVSAALGRGLGDRELADYAVSVLRSQRWVHLLPVTQALAIRAARIAAEQKIRGCDAIYVALAQQLGMELVTLDGDQLNRGAAVVRTRTP